MIVATACALSGCGGGGRPPLKTAALAGKVTFKGQPVKAGAIVFESRELGVVRGFPIENGAFSGTDVPVGKYLVKIVPPVVEAKSADPAEMAKKPEAADIPAKYHSTDTSGLKADVKENDPNDKLAFDMPG